MRYYMPWNRRPANNTGKIALGALAGIVAGLTAGILAAPRAGSETRRIISNRTGETMHKVGKSIAATKDRALKKGREKAEEAVSGL
jgi:gas vesicle protein